MAMEAEGKPFDVGIPFKMRGQCQVCNYKGYVLLVGKDDFVAKYFKLSDNVNEICTECWMKAKAQDPEKGKFSVKLDQGQHAWGIKDQK